MLVTSIFSFSYNVFYSIKVRIYITFKVIICKLSVWKSLNFVVWSGVNHPQSTGIICSIIIIDDRKQPNNPGVQQPWKSSLLKTLWEKEKMLVTSIFSFSHNIFFSVNQLLQILSFETVLKFCLLTHYQTKF